MFCPNFEQPWRDPRPLRPCFRHLGWGSWITGSPAHPSETLPCARETEEPAHPGLALHGLWSSWGQERAGDLPYLLRFREYVGHRCSSFSHGCIQTVLLSSFLSFFLFFFDMPQRMWDLSFPAQDWTHTPCSGSEEFNHRTTRESCVIIL